MIKFYKLKFWKNHKNKLIFYSKNNIHLRDEILKEGNSSKNLQKIKFNQKQTFTIKKKFTLDWHTRSNSNFKSKQISKHQKILKLASFYSQLNSANFSKKFTSLMILNLKTQIKNLEDVKQPNLRVQKTIELVPDRIHKIPNSKEFEKNNQQQFLNLQYKVWFSKIFMPFSNRNYWWILLSTQSILTHIHLRIYFKRITNIFSILQHSKSPQYFLNSTLLFDSFPEFLIEKPIYWYLMLPFFGFIGLISSNLNLSFFENPYSTYNLQNKVEFKIYPAFYQHEIENSISWEMFQFFDYKKILFDYSLKYLNKLSLNNDILLIQIKKSWLSRQREHYICNYKDNLIEKNLNKNLNQFSTLTTLHWWKINWDNVTSQKSQSNSIELENSILSNPKQETSLLDTKFFKSIDIKKNAKFCSFDSLFYSKFYWYWHTLDTRNTYNCIDLNTYNCIDKIQLYGYKNELQDSYNSMCFQKVLKDYNSNFLCPFSMSSTASSNYTMNEFPLKMQFPWFFADLQKINQKNHCQYQTNENFDSITKKIDNHFRNIGVNFTYQNNNNKKSSKNVIEFQIKKMNLKFKKMLDFNFFQIQNSNFITFKDTYNCIDLPFFSIKFKNSNQSISSFLFCISSKKKSIIKQDKLVKQSLLLQKTPIHGKLNDKNKNIYNYNCIDDNVKLRNKKRIFSELTLYNGIGCEILESELNPVYNDTYNCTDFKKNQSIFSFNKASFLLNNFLSKFYFESGISCLTTQYLINYFYNILNLNKFDNNTHKIEHVYSILNYEKLIQIQKYPIVMSGYNLPHLKTRSQEQNQISKNLSNQIIINQIRCHLPPNIISNQLKLQNFLKYDQTQHRKTYFYQTLNKVRDSYFFKKQNLCILNKKFSKIDSKSKNFEHFVIFNLVKSSKNLKPRKLKINIKKMEYSKQFFNIKTNYKYQTMRPNFFLNNKFNNSILHLKKKILKIKENQMKRNMTNNNEHTSSFLLGYSNYIIKEKINSILRKPILSQKPQTTLFSSIIYSDRKLLSIKREPKRIFTFLNFNIIPKSIYISNKSIFCNYINSTYNSSGLFNTNKPFVFDKFQQFIKNIRINIISRNNKNFQNSNYFSNLLLQKYQRKSKNWPGGANPQGFFYKRINKLNFKQIQKKQNMEKSSMQNNTEIGNLFNFQSNIFKQLKNISASKPVAELLWDVRTKHKIPEVLLIQQTLFFQKKLVRKSTEENNIVNQYSSKDEGLKMQTLLRKMTQRRHFRKHVFLETLFNWTRDGVSLRKMLRKIYLKNNWQIFFKYIFKSKHIQLYRSDYYSNWYKKTFYNNVKQNILFHYFHTTFFNVNSQKVIKTEKIRPFFGKLSQTKNNKKLFQSKNNINLVLNHLSKNLSIDFNLLKILDNKNTYNCIDNIHTIERISNFTSFQNCVSNNPLVSPEWKMFDDLTLLNVFIQTKFRKLIKKENNTHTFKEERVCFINNDSLDPLSLILINQVNTNQNTYNCIDNFVNQRNLSKLGFLLYNMSDNTIFQFTNTNNRTSLFNLNKKLHNDDRKPIDFNFVSSFLSYLNKNLNINKENDYKTKLKSKQPDSFFNLNLSNIFNFSLYYKTLQDKHSNKYFEIQNNNFLQKKLLEKNVRKSKLNFYLNQLSIRNRLLYQKLYFTNILWHSTDFVLNTNSTIFTENQIIKNVIKQNWVFQTRPIYSHSFFDRELNLNFNNLLATLSTWQLRFQIKRDLILQIFSIYLDHAGAFLNYIIKNLILDDIFNHIQNWNLFQQTLTTTVKIKKNHIYNCMCLEKDFITKPTWSFDLLNHIKTQYPHLYNQIQIRNQSNSNNIQALNTLIKTAEFQSNNEIIFSPNFKAQLPLIDSFRKNSGKNVQFLNNYNMLSNMYTNSINMEFIDESIIKKLSSHSLIIRNSTIFCQKWIKNRQLYNYYKIQFLKKQQKLRQILNIIKFKNDLRKRNFINPFYNNEINLDYKRKDFIEKNIINFKRRSGFLFTRSLITRNFNNFSSFSTVTRASLSIYLNRNSENISVRNFVFLMQILLLHVCLIFCLINVYQSTFHFCLKSFISIFVILIHYFLNIKYRLKRLIKYIYQSTAQSFITNIQEYVYSSQSLHSKLFVFFNNLSTGVFYNKFSIWGKIFNTSIPSLTNFLFKNPFFHSNNFDRIKLIKSKNVVNSKNHSIFSETAKRKKINNLKSFFDDVEFNDIRNRRSLNFQFDLLSKRNLFKIISQRKENNRMSLLRNTNFIQKSYLGKMQNDNCIYSNETENINTFNRMNPTLPWEKENLNKGNTYNCIDIKNKKRKKIKNNDSSVFQLSFKLIKWNLGLILLIGESEIFAELEPYREMHWYFLKRLPIFLRSNTYLEDPINMYDYQADEKLRKFKEQFKKSTEIFQKRQNTIERKTERNRKKEHGDDVERNKIVNSSEIQHFELINKKNSYYWNFFTKQKQADNIILFIKSEKQLKEKSIKLLDIKYLTKITHIFNNFYFLRKKISRGQPFWKPFFSFLAYTLFISRLAKLNRQFRDSVLIINYVWIPFGPLTSILSSFLWKNWILNFSTLLNNQNSLLNKLKINVQLNLYNQTCLYNSMRSSYNFKKLEFLEIYESQYKFNQNHNLKEISSYCSPFKVTSFIPNKIHNFESKQLSYEIQQFWENINTHNNLFSQYSPPLLNRVFLWNFFKFEKKYQRAILKWSDREKNRKNDFDFIPFFSKNINSKIDTIHSIVSIINKYQSLYINNQEQSAQNRYINYQTYDPKVRLYRFYTNFSKNLYDIGIIQDAKNVHPLFGSLLCEIYSGLLSSATKSRTQYSSKHQNKHLSFFSSTKNVLLVGNNNSSNFVLLVQAFSAETGLKLFMEDAKRLRRLGRRGINKSTKRLEKLFEIAQAHSPCIVFLEDIDVIGSKRRVIKINEEEDDEDMAIRSFFSKLIYRKQHNYKSLRQSFIHQNLFISNEENYRNMQKSIVPESPIPSNLIEYQLTRRKAFSNYFSNTSNSSYKIFLTKFNKKFSSITGNYSTNVSSSPTNTVIIWKLLKSKLVTPKKTIKETPWKHIPVDSMRSIPLITYSIRVKVAKLTMLAIYTMNTQLRLVKDLIKLLEKIQYESYKGFIVFATTNKLALLDPSLRRPGRFDETIYLPSLTVNPNYQRFSAIHFLNVLSVDSQDFVNFYRTFNIVNSMNFAIDWNLNSVYGNVFIQDNSEKIFYPTRTSLRDLINLNADSVYNQNIFMQNENNIYQNLIPFDIWGNIGFQKSDFSIYSKSALLLSLAYSKAGQLIIKLFFQERYSRDTYNCIDKVAFNSENNQLTIWPNSHIFAQSKKINISYTNQNKNIKNFLIHYFAGKVGEFCFFSFYRNSQNNGMHLFQKNKINLNKKIKINYLFEKNAFGLRSLYGIQPNWKNLNSVIFSLSRTSCLYSKNHLTSKLFYLDDIFKKRQRIFSENFGPSLLFEYFNLNTESFLKKNIIPLEEHLQKLQTQKYLLNLQQKPLRKFLFDSTSIKISKSYSYLNTIYNRTKFFKSIDKTDKVQKKNTLRLAIFRILFNELGSLDLITLRPTAMNYYYDKKIYQKQRFRKYTYKWWNWHLKKTIDSLEEFQYLDYFPYEEKQYNPRRQRWMLTNGYSAYWLAQEKILYYQIYEQLIIECFQISYLQLDKHREMLDYLVQLLMSKQLLTEIQWILFFKRFV
jgi:hypothetical protein